MFAIREKISFDAITPPLSEVKFVKGRYARYSLLDLNVLCSLSKHYLHLHLRESNALSSPTDIKLRKYYPQVQSALFKKHQRCFQRQQTHSVLEA